MITQPRCISEFETSRSYSGEYYTQHITHTTHVHKKLVELFSLKSFVFGCDGCLCVTVVRSAWP